MKSAIREKIMSRGGGVGESKVFNAPDAPSAYEALAGRHVGGKPIEELPEEVVALLTVQHTDEDIAERNREKAESAARVTSSVRARSTGSDFEKSVAERGDFRRNATVKEFYECPDPGKEIEERFCPPGFKGAFLSPLKIEREGARGYEIVKQPNGEPVKMGRMPFGIQPIEKVQARKEFYRRKGGDQLSRIEQEHMERQREISGDD